MAASLMAIAVAAWMLKAAFTLGATIIKPGRRAGATCCHPGPTNTATTGRGDPDDGHPGRAPATAGAGAGRADRHAAAELLRGLGGSAHGQRHHPGCSSCCSCQGLWTRNACAAGSHGALKITMLRLNNVSKHFGGLKVLLQDGGFDVPGPRLQPDRLTARSQKTVFNLVTGLLAPSGTKIELRSQSLLRACRRTVTRRGIAAFRTSACSGDMTRPDQRGGGGHACAQTTACRAGCCYAHVPRQGARLKGARELKWVGLGAKERRNIADNLSYSDQRSWNWPTCADRRPRLLRWTNRWPVTNEDQADGRHQQRITPTQLHHLHDRVRHALRRPGLCRRIAVLNFVRIAEARRAADPEQTLNVIEGVPQQRRRNATERRRKALCLPMSGVPRATCRSPTATSKPWGIQLRGACQRDPHLGRHGAGSRCWRCQGCTAPKAGSIRFEGEADEAGATA